jgi:archaemetzincin
MHRLIKSILFSGKQIFFLLVIVILAACSDQKTIAKKCIALQPYVGFDDKLVTTIQTALDQVYGMESIVLPEVDLPAEAFINVKSPRYRADSLLRHLKRIQPDTVNYILGLTHKDISTTKKDAYGKVREPHSKYQDWGIMGLGFRPGSSCVISTFRIKAPSNKLFLERLRKISVHEIGHNLGLPHCETDSCVMRDAAETVKTVDAVKLWLCDGCKSSIGL